jgi:F0F1-type ATP synthase membrane subunit b/b'
LFSILPQQYGKTRMMLETYAPVLIIVVVLFLWELIYPVIGPIFKAFTGI